MIGEGLSLVVALVLPWVLGIASVTTLGFHIRRDGPTVLAWGWLGGMFLVAVLTFLALVLRVPLAVLPWSVAAVSAGLAAPQVIAAMRRRRDGPQPWTAPRAGLAYLAGIAVALIPLLHGILVTNAIPAVDGDAAFIWAAKAKLLYLEGGFTDRVGERLAFASRMMLDVEHADYPMLHPLNQVWFFASCGDIRLCDARLPSQLAGLAAVLATIGAVRRVAGRLLAVLIGLVVAAGLTRATAAADGMADGIVGFCFLVAVDCACRHVESGEVRWWRLMNVALASLLWTKNEGVLLSVALVSGLVLAAALRRVPWRALRPARRTELLWGSLLVVGPTITLWFTTRYGLANDMLHAPSTGKSFVAAVPEHLADRGPAVLSWFVRNVVLDVENVSGIFAVWLIGTAVFARRAWTGTSFVVTTTALAAAAGIALVFIGTPHSLTWHLETAGLRVWSQSLGVVGLALGLLAGPPPSASRPNARP